MLQSVEASSEKVREAGLEHRVYIPSLAPNERSAAVLLVHGRAGDARVPWVFSKAFQELKPVTIAPQAMLDDPLGGYSWWQVEDDPKNGGDTKQRTRLSDLKPALDKLETFVRSLPRLYPVDENKIYAVGFSQGAALVSSLSLVRPELFQGVAMLSGFLPRVRLAELSSSENDSPDARLQRPQYFIAHGTNDDVVPFARSEEARDELLRLGAKVFFHRDDVTHKVGTAGIKALTAWFRELLR